MDSEDTNVPTPSKSETSDLGAQIVHKMKWNAHQQLLPVLPYRIHDGSVGP